MNKRVSSADGDLRERLQRFARSPMFLLPTGLASALSLAIAFPTSADSLLQESHGPQSPSIASGGGDVSIDFSTMHVTPVARRYEIRHPTGVAGLAADPTSFATIDMTGQFTVVSGTPVEILAGTERLPNGLEIQEVLITEGRRRGQVGWVWVGLLAYD